MKILEYILIFTGAVLLFIFSSTALAGIFNIGNIVGIAFAIILLLLGFFLERLIKLVKNIWRKKAMRAVFISLSSVITAVLLCFFIALGATVGASSNNAFKNETVIILGCAVYGETPSSMLSSRVNIAYEYMKENPDTVAVLSGGQGKDEDISEAECMKRILIKKGIDGNRLFIEDKSTNTNQNIEFSAKIIQENRLSKNVVIATSDFHLKRSTMIAEKNGLSPQRLSAKTLGFSLPVFYVRDTLGVIKEFIFK